MSQQAHIGEQTKSYEEQLQKWNANEEIAELILPLIGKLYRNRDVVLSIYGRKIAHSP